MTGVIHDVEGQPRCRAEMPFAVSLIPCPDCGTAETATPNVQGTVYWPVYAWACPGCGTERGYRFRIPTDLPQFAIRPGELGGDEPSRIITAEALAAEARRLTPLVPAAPETLDPDDWETGRDRLLRLRVCFNELAKVPGHDVDADRARLDGIYARFTADVERYGARRRWRYPPRPEPRGAIDRDTVRAHERWVRGGFTGEGRLDVAHVDARNLPFGACELRRSRFTGVLVEGANAEHSSFAEAEWNRVYARGARLASTTWDGARLDECELQGAAVDLGKLRRATVTGGDWDQVRLERAVVDGAVFERVSLREAWLVDARLDGARFVECDLRGANLTVDLDYLPLGTNVGTRFVDCDLRGLIVTGRRDLEI